VQVLVSAVILLVPTFLMGGTLPILSRFMATRRGQVGSAVGLLYGLNTLGAAAGAFLTGFVLVKALGTLKTIYLAAGINGGLALVFVLLHAAWRAGEPGAVEEEAAGAEEAPLSAGRLRLLLLAVAVSGFVSFSYEVLWTRLLQFKFESTVYAFSIMLTMFLLGLGLGGAVVGVLKRTAARAHYWRIYGLLEAAIGICGLASILLFFSARHTYESFTVRVVGELGTAALVMLVPTTLMGAAFPIACHLFAAGVGQTGESVGRIYVFNTVGAVLGALTTGFYLVRAIGTQHSLTLASFLIVASGTAILVAAPHPAGEALEAKSRRLRRLLPVPAVWAAAILVCALTPSRHLQNYFVKNQSVSISNPDKEVSLLGYAEGVEGVVVACQVEDGYKTISAGSTDVAGTSYVLRNTQKLQAHIPMLIHPDPKWVCQVGFGSGETAHIFSSYDVEQFDCVEISRAMLDLAGEHFLDINQGVLDRPNFHEILMDAAAYLKYADRKYDIIANDATWPSQAGPAMLFTLEYFQSGRARLKPGGIMTSWLPLDMPFQDLKAVLKTFHQVFEHVYIWSSLNHMNKHALIAGSDTPLRIDAARFRERFNRFARKDLEAVYLGDPAVFLTCHTAKVQGMEGELADAPLSTNHLPVLRFMYSRLYATEHMLKDAYGLLARHRDSVLGHLTNVEALDDSDQFLGAVRRLEAANDQILRAMTLGSDNLRERDLAMHRAIELAPEHPARILWLQRLDELRMVTPDEIRGSDLPALRDLARSLFRAGRYDTALIAMEEWAAREPESAEAWTALGSWHTVNGRFAEAIQHLLKAEALAPESADVHFNLGVAYVRANQLPSAVPHLRKAVDLAPESAEARAHLGTAIGLLGDDVGALRHLSRAVALNPRLPDAQRNLGMLLLRMGSVDEAISHLKTCAALTPESAEAHHLLARAYRRAGDEEVAARYSQRAAQLEAAQRRSGQSQPSEERYR
jgi:spermidine synthase